MTASQTEARKRQGAARSRFPSRYYSVYHERTDDPTRRACGRRAAFRPRSLAVALAERLRDMIIEGELPAGTRLNERALCDRLGVSRTPLREAFRVLAAEHLVELQPNRGARW